MTLDISSSRHTRQRAGAASGMSVELLRRSQSPNGLCLSQSNSRNRFVLLGNSLEHSAHLNNTSTAFPLNNIRPRCLGFSTFWLLYTANQLVFTFKETIPT